jgi:FkbM family methyltransferase
LEFYNKVYKRLYKLKSRINPLIRYLKERKLVEQRKEFYGTFLKEDDLCFDVGANYGNRAKTFVDLKARVVAVEPQKKCCDHLQRKFKKRITVINKGLGARQEIKNFYEADLSALSTFSEEWMETVKKTRFKQHSWHTTEKIEVTTLEKLIEEFGIPSFIKIDVEGYETEVLSGLDTPISMISFEYTVPEKTDKIITCIKKIESINSDIECNYSVRESMQFSLAKWVRVQEMFHIVNTNEFIATSAGDIYVRLCGNVSFEDKKYETAKIIL